MKPTKKPAWRRRKVAERTEPAEAGLHLVVSLTEGNELTILRSAPVPTVPRHDLKAPYLDPSRKYAFKRTTSELVLDLLDAKGQVVESFGWLWTSEAFSDHPVRELYGGIRGGRVQSENPLRVFLVPMPASVHSLLFSRSIVEANEEGRPVRRIALGHFFQTPPPPSVPFAVQFAPKPLPGPVSLVEVL